jgi:hypothetical protein
VLHSFTCSIGSRDSGKALFLRTTLRVIRQESDSAAIGYRGGQVAAAISNGIAGFSGQS